MHVTDIGRRSEKDCTLFTFGIGVITDTFHQLGDLPVRKISLNKKVTSFAIELDRYLINHQGTLSQHEVFLTALNIAATSFVVNCALSLSSFPQE